MGYKSIIPSYFNKPLSRASLWLMQTFRLLRLFHFYWLIFSSRSPECLSKVFLTSESLKMQTAISNHQTARPGPSVINKKCPRKI